MGRRSRQVKDEASETSAVGRPDGTDGSDFNYRMVVDDKYKKIAGHKLTLQKLIGIQTMHILIRGLWIALIAFQGETFPDSVLAMLIFGAGASWFGTLALKSTKSFSLRLYIFFTVLSITLTSWPLIRGYTYARAVALFNEEKWGEDFTRTILCIVEMGQDVVGILVQNVGLWVAVSVLKLGQTKK